jgi:hypothetical protein
VCVFMTYHHVIIIRLKMANNFNIKKRVHWVMRCVTQHTRWCAP